MCYKIDADFILIQKLLNQENCTISELFNEKLEIENHFTNVFVDVSKSSIIGFVLCYPKYFKIEDNKITKLEGADSFIKSIIDGYLYKKIDGSIREDIKSHFQSA